MTGGWRLLIVAAVIIGLLVLGSVFVKSSPMTPPHASGHNIDPTADIHPSVILEGQVTVGGSRAEVPDRSILGDGCWINHGATMHGTQIGDGGAVGLNACCDYNTRIGKGAILADGSATHVDQVIPDNSFAEGVPALVKKTDITDQDRLDYFGVLPSAWTHYEAANIEAGIRAKQ